jgi:hypothetical protein
MLLTYSMEHSPSWEANWFSASQEILRILLNPKVHYRNHNYPPTVSILSQLNAVKILYEKVYINGETTNAFCHVIMYK